MPLSGEEYVLGNPAEHELPRAVYEERVRAYTDAGATMKVARDLARSTLSRGAALKLVRDRCPADLIHKIAS